MGILYLITTLIDNLEDLYPWAVLETQGAMCSLPVR
jgi:hypothetical protein